MENVDLLTYIIIFFAYLVGGFMDSIVGGGGIITVSSAFLAMPSLHYSTVIGTNKFGASPGTLYSAIKFLRNYSPKLSIILLTIVVCSLGGLSGGYLATLSDKETLLPVAISCMILMVIYSYLNQEFGLYADYDEDFSTNAIITGMGTLFIVAIYDGVVGPGSGSLMTFAVIRYFKINFIKAATFARVGGAASIITAMLYLGSEVSIIWGLVPVMVAGNIIGSMIGVRVAISKGDGFIKILFMAISTLLIMKMMIDYYHEFMVHYG